MAAALLTPKLNEHRVQHHINRYSRNPGLAVSEHLKGFFVADEWLLAIMRSSTEFLSRIKRCGFVLPEQASDRLTNKARERLRDQFCNDFGRLGVELARAMSAGYKPKFLQLEGPVDPVEVQGEDVNPTFALLLPYVDGGFHVGKLIRALMPDDVQFNRSLIARYVKDGAHKAWFLTTLRWHRLMFFELFHKDMVVDLLRNTVNSFPGALSRAHNVLSTNPLDENALLIVQASKWSPHSNRLFPEATRLRAIDLLKIGYKLNLKFGDGFMDVWRGFVMVHALSRRD